MAFGHRSAVVGLGHQCAPFQKRLAVCCFGPSVGIPKIDNLRQFGRHFTDDVKEVRQGFECGIRLDNFTDFDVDDIIEVYEYKESRATL